MNKREFLKSSGMLVAGAALSRVAQGEQQPAQHSGQPIALDTKPRMNWSENYTYSTDRLYLPRSAEEVQQLVKQCDKAKALGVGHSFNRIADSSHEQISLKHLDSMELDKQARTVTVGGGVTYDQLAPYLQRNGYALHNLASLTEITVAGACATATHGSGNKNGNLATAVAGMEMVTADGNVLALSRARDGDKFAGAVVHLGALGMVTKLTLNVEPTYEIAQVVYQNLSIAQLEHNLEAIFASGYSVSLFTDWQNHRIDQVWIKRRVEADKPTPMPPQFYGATLATKKLHPITGHDAESCTEQMGVPGPWFERLPHFRIGFTPSSGHELQTEYFVPYEQGYPAILAVEKLRDRITPLLFVTELRRIHADDFWLSPCYRQSSMTIHFTWKPEWPAVKQVLPMIEAALAPFNAKPHWAKMFTMAPSRIDSLYARMPEYRTLMAQHDPQGKFRNKFLNADVFGG
jgi:xylitol oxidase